MRQGHNKSVLKLVIWYETETRDVSKFLYKTVTNNLYNTNVAFKKILLSSHLYQVLLCYLLSNSTSFWPEMGNKYCFFHWLAQLSSVVEKIVVMPFYLEEKITFYRCQCNEVGPRYWLSVADLQVIPSPLSTRSKNPRQTRIEKVQNNQNRPKNVENQVNWPKISQKHVSYWKHPPQDKKRETHPPNPIANPQTQTPTQFVCLLHRNLLLGLVWHHLPVTFIQWNLKHHKIIIHLYFSSLESLLGLQASST